MSDDLRSTAASYFSAWKTGDFHSLRSILADDVSFRGPLGTADGKEDCVAGLERMAPMLTDIDIVKVFVDQTDVLTWFNLHTEKTSPTPTANWMHIVDGKIARIRVTFDPRELIAQMYSVSRD
jgi:ketosteroid isomerase-like protein